MTKNEYAQYLQSPHWKKVRSDFLDIFQWCAQCSTPRWLAELAYDQDLNVHHRHYGTLGRESHEDLEALCRRCHEVETFGRSDLRPIHSHYCDRCNSIMFDPRADICGDCRLILNPALIAGMITEPIDGETEEYYARVSETICRIRENVGVTANG